MGLVLFSSLFSVFLIFLLFGVFVLANIFNLWFAAFLLILLIRFFFVIRDFIPSLFLDLEFDGIANELRMFLDNILEFLFQLLCLIRAVRSTTTVHNLNVFH